MANERVFKLRGLEVDAAAVGGLQSLNLTPSFANVVQSTPDGAPGPQTVDLSGAQLALNFASTDWQKSIACIVDNAGVLTFALVHSGAITEHEVTTAGLVFTGLGLNFQRNADAVMTLDGLFRDAGTAASWQELMAEFLARVDVQTASREDFPQTFPARGYRPNNAEFVESTGTAGVNELAIPHLQSVSMRVAANVQQDNADDDIGMTAVDIESWGLWDVSLMYRAANLYATTTPWATAAAGNVLAARLIGMTDGRLTFDVTGRAGGAANDKTVTLNGVKWTDVAEGMSQGYATYTLNGKAQWRTTGNFAGAATPIDYDWAADAPIAAILGIA